MSIISENCSFCGEKFTKLHKWQVNCSKKCTKRKYIKKMAVIKNRDSSFVDINRFNTTETGIGFKWEKYIADKLGAKHLEFNSRGLDIDWNGKLIDVKSGHLNKRKNKRGKPVVGEQKGYWNFKGWGLNEPSLFICVCVGDDDKPVKILFIPPKDYPKIGITVGWKSKYDKYSKEL